MFVRNTQPDLFALALEPCPGTNGLSLQMTCGSWLHPLGKGHIRLSLMGFCFKLSHPSPSTTNGVNGFFDPIVAIAQGQWPDCYAFTTEHRATLFRSGTEGLLGVVNAKDLPPLPLDSLLAVEISAADLRVLDAEGLWFHDISPNTHGVLERLAIQHLLQQLVQPLSAVWFGEESSFPLLHQPLAADLSESATLPTAIADLSHADPNLQTLLGVAQLNPAQDLIGINFMGGDLRNLDLSGANLSRANLRGADLSDGDFSDANLSFARLSGADLSGALLSQANLQHANLYRASLALANLGGADLQGADLRGANLHHINLSSAKVAGTRWGNNEGISPETIAYLRSAGAIEVPEP